MTRRSVASEFGYQPLGVGQGARVALSVNGRFCEGLRMSAPWWWGGRHEGPAYANLQRRKPREV